MTSLHQFAWRYHDMFEIMGNYVLSLLRSWFNLPLQRKWHEIKDDDCVAFLNSIYAVVVTSNTLRWRLRKWWACEIKRGVLHSVGDLIHWTEIGC